MTGFGSDPCTTADLIRAHCINNNFSVINRVPIARVVSRPMRYLLWMIVHLEEAKSQHVATKAQVLLALDCMEP